MMDIKQQLDATIGQAPSTSIDIDATIRRMHRRVWTVRSAVAATAAGVAAGLVLAVPILANDPRPPQTPGQTQAVLPAAPKPESEQELADRLTVAVQAKLAVLLPGATLIPGWAGHEAAVVYPFRPVSVPNTLPWAYLQAQADVRDQQGTGSIDILIGRMTPDPRATDYCPKGEDARRAVQVHPSSAWGDPDNENCNIRAPVGYPLGGYESCADYYQGLDSDGECSELTTGAGDRVVMVRGTHDYRVDVARSDGTAVIVISDARAAGGGTRPAPPLTIEQLLDLATDRSLAL
jgi:hypothetical protein